ncbi:MAG: uroporphyrinogen-III synthase [Kiritimatiellae bacterium]|nr:uroporphyrinogen-III synthase [Kiritimatiellia bacterium]
MKKERFTVGARGSALSLAQTAGALDFLRARFPGTDYRVVTVETPGDRDLTTPIEKSAPDFFTRDLDEAVRDGRIDFAIHSAKDLPPEIADDLDWFWLPERADPRDCWVVRKGRAAARPSWIGVSSERRAAYAKKAYPKAKLLPIRGSIDSRIQQLRDGRYDAVLMALAGITRLYGGTPSGVELIPIPLEELTPPEAQGYLAVVFRAGDARLMTMRAHFVKAVRFVSAGVGDAGLCTVRGRRDLEEADVVLADELLGKGLVRGNLSTGKMPVVPVGKRCGAHTMKQAEITRLICDEARKGRRVVRLKGGDAGLFGRLAEETDALTALQIPFVVRPGVSALVAATTGTGLLLTRRGESRGFTAYTPRSTGTETPQVAFMATRMASEEARRLVREGWPRTTPCAFVFDAAGPREEVRTATLGTVRKILPAKEEERPGLFIVGRVAAHGGWPRLGPLAGRRVLVTCSDAVQERAATVVEDLGGRPIRWPLIELRATRAFGEEVADYDAIVLTSPSAVRIFFANCTCDVRRLGAFYTCGAGTDAELRRHGISSDVVPAKDFSAAGLVAEIKKLDLRGKRVLRLRSAKAGPDVARALRRAGAKVDDVVLYANEAYAPEGVLPPFDDVFFASASAVESFLARYGAGALRGKGVFVMGGPTRRALPKSFSAKARIFDIMAATLGARGSDPIGGTPRKLGRTY